MPAPKHTDTDPQPLTIPEGNHAWGRGAQHTSPVNFESIIAGIDERNAEVIRWWFFYCRDNNLSLQKLAQLAGVSSSALSLLFRGKYNAGLDQICSTLAKARETIQESVANPYFIMTSLARRMFMIFDRTRALQTVAICWGAMGIGKTVIGEEYRARNNHGRTIYVCCDSGMTLNSFVVMLAAALGLAVKSRTQMQLREGIRKLLSAGQRLVIVDEMHQLFLTTRSDSAIRIAEYLRLLQDNCKFGLVLLGTEVLRDEIFHGPHKDALRQLVDRGTIQVQLPTKPTKKDITSCFDHYGLPVPTADTEPEAAKILADIIAASGLRKLTLHLRDGAATAKKAGETYTWSHFVQAFRDIASLAAN